MFLRIARTSREAEEGERQDSGDEDAAVHRESAEDNPSTSDRFHDGGERSLDADAHTRIRVPSSHAMVAA